MGNFVNSASGIFSMTCLYFCIKIQVTYTMPKQLLKLCQLNNDIVNFSKTNILQRPCFCNPCVTFLRTLNLHLSNTSIYWRDWAYTCTIVLYIQLKMY